MTRGVPKAGKRQPRQPKIGLPSGMPAGLSSGMAPPMPSPDIGATPAPTMMKRGGKVAYKSDGSVKHHKPDGSSHQAVDHLKKSKKF